MLEEGFMRGSGGIVECKQEGYLRWSGLWGPKMNREADKTFFTWEYTSQGRQSENMSNSRASSVLILLEDLLGGAPDYDNFIKHNCFKSDESRYTFF